VSAANDGDSKVPSQATRLVKYATTALDLWHTAEPLACATTQERPHQSWPLRSKTARQFLSRLFYLKEGTAPGGDAIPTALATLEGIAVHDGPEHALSTRLAEHDGRIYLDLGDTDRRAAVVGPNGWQVVEELPVYFRRSRGMLALPVPERGGHIDELRKLVNVATDDDWKLLVSWLLAALRPNGPYPVLCLYGEAGAAKSTLERLLRSLVDPSSAPLRSEPRDPRDLIIAATNSWVVALDNLSHLPPWLSDALCRLASGGGYATRELYSDSEEVLFDAQRPVILNGIEELTTRGDLLDRALIVTLPAINEKDRRTEEDLAKAFEAARPRILGALLDAVSVGLGNLPSIADVQLPRMADFARWVTACEPALGWEPSAFVRAYRGNVRDANELALADSPLVTPLRMFLDDQPQQSWTGTASDLLQALGELADERLVASRDWPKRPHALSGRLRRLAPNLRKTGLAVDFVRTNTVRQIVLSTIKFGKEASRASQASQAVGNARKRSDAPAPPDDRGASRERQGVSRDTAKNAEKTRLRDTCDTRDTEKHSFSGPNSRRRLKKVSERLIGARESAETNAEYSTRNGEVHQ
jgi:hypothetical protein